jgi:hypothetical protein
MSYRPLKGKEGSNQQLWLEFQDDMGGQFWPPEPEESGMAEYVGRKHPMMLYSGNKEVVVYDDDEEAEARANGFTDHQALTAAPSEPEPPPGEVNPQKPAVAVTRTATTTVTPSPSAVPKVQPKR